ncbi:MAG TPA: hypothetical protein VF941_10915 [Clostridia bacterium]
MKKVESEAIKNEFRTLFWANLLETKEKYNKPEALILGETESEAHKNFTDLNYKTMRKLILKYNVSENFVLKCLKEIYQEIIDNLERNLKSKTED